MAFRDMPNPIDPQFYVDRMERNAAKLSGRDRKIADTILANKPVIDQVAREAADQDHREILEAIAEVLAENGIAVD